MIRGSIYTKSKATEKQAIGVLKLILSNKLIEKLTSGDDTFPDTDGHVQLLTENRETTGLNLEVQIKSLSYAKKNKAPFSKCPSKLLLYAGSSNLPLLFIAVDLTSQVAYWRYLSKELVTKIFEKGNVPKEMTLYFDLRNIIKQGEDSYLKEWKDICNHHFNKTNDNLIKDLLSDQKDVTYYYPDVFVEKLKMINKLAHYRSIKGEYLMVPHILLLGQNIILLSATSLLDKKIYTEYLEVLDTIRYYESGEVFKILFSLSKLNLPRETQSIIQEKLKHLVSYNYHALVVFNYEPQSKIIEILNTFSLEDKIKHFDILNIVYQFLLSPSFDGTSMRDDITMVFHRGPLNVSPFLIRFRKNLVVELVEMFKKAEISKKLKILQTVTCCAHVPSEEMNDEQKEKIYKMIEDEVKFLINELSNSIFKNNKIIAELPVALKIEQELIWIKKVHGKNVPEVGRLVLRLKSDIGRYGFYRLMVGEAHQFWDENYETIDQEWKSAINVHLELISYKNIDKYLEDLSYIAKMTVFETDNGFLNFRNFLVDIGRKKPDIAKEVILKSIRQKLPLSKNFTELIGGLRNNGNRQILDSSLDVLIKKRKLEHAIAIASSFLYLDKENLPKINNQDIKTLENIILKRDKFKFASLPLNNRDFHFIFYGIFILWPLKPEKCKKLFLELCKIYPEEVIRSFLTIDFNLRDKTFALNGWSKNELLQLCNLLVKCSSLEHHGTRILLALGEADFTLFLDVFRRRMLEKEKFRRDLKSGYYDAIPWHADELKPLFESNSEELKKIVREWSKKYSVKAPVFSFNLSVFLDAFAPLVSQKIVLDLISSHKKADISEAINLLPRFDSLDIEFCLKIVEITDDADVLNSLKGRLMNLGDVSGSADEDIFGKAWRNRANDFEQILKVKHSKKTEKFIKEIIKVLQEMAVNSEKEHQIKLEKRRQQKESSDDI